MFLMKRKLKDNFVFLRILTAKIDEIGKLTAIESKEFKLRDFKVQNLSNHIVIQRFEIKLSLTFRIILEKLIVLLFNMISKHILFNRKVGLKLDLSCAFIIIHY
jgi:hypothetical protein